MFDRPADPENVTGTLARVLPDPRPTRYRCGACGNLTRFDVTVTRRERAFHHYSIGGELEIEDRETLSEHVEEVSCRWCGHGRAIERIDGGELSGSEV
jgi:hypothetical protein